MRNGAAVSTMLLKPCTQTMNGCSSQPNATCGDDKSQGQAPTQSDIPKYLKNGEMEEEHFVCDVGPPERLEYRAYEISYPKHDERVAERFNIYSPIVEEPQYV